MKNTQLTRSAKKNVFLIIKKKSCINTHNTPKIKKFKKI